MMKNWFQRLMAFLAGKGRTRTPRRTDWRGRPLGENTEGGIPPVRLPEGGPYATIRLPWYGERAGDAPGVPPGKEFGSRSAAPDEEMHHGRDNRADSRPDRV
jgi:hypothetical protein